MMQKQITGMCIVSLANNVLQVNNLDCKSSCVFMLHSLCSNNMIKCYNKVQCIIIIIKTSRYIVL